jgi:plastocyanin
MSKRFSLLAVPLILSALAIGCGDDSNSPSSPNDPGGFSAGTPLPADGVAVTIMGVRGVNSFFPSTVTVHKGQIIEWRNTDNQDHQLVSDIGLFDTGTIKSGTTSSTLRISKPATYHYHCVEHPRMVGSIVVNP